MTPNWTWITPCRDRLEYLKLTLPHLAAHAPVVLVDYGCKEMCSDWARKQSFNYPVKIVTNDLNEYYNHAAALNSGAGAVSDDVSHLVFADCDVQIGENLVTYLPSYLAQKNTITVDNQTHPRLLAVSRDRFHFLQAFEMDMIHYGNVCRTLLNKAHIVEGKIEVIPHGFVQHINHTDEERVKNFRIKDVLENIHENDLIAQVRVERFKRALGLMPR